MHLSVRLSKFFTLLNRVRWFLTLFILFPAVGLVWYGWHTSRGLAWIAIFEALLLLLLALVWGSNIARLLARRIEHQIVHKQIMSAHELVDSSLQQGEKLVQSSNKKFKKNINSTRQSLDQALYRFRQDWQRGKGKVTWITASPFQEPGPVCQACGQRQRNGAKFCDRCGKPIFRF